MRARTIIATVIALVLLSVSMRAASAEEGDQSVELAKKLSNPVAALISVPLQFNYDSDLGPDENGDQYLLNFQPVVPISIDEEWNLISRTIVPILHQEDVFPGTGASSGIGNILQSVFFSPKAPTKQGIIWGVGPAIQLPTASTERFGPDQWSLGPTFVVLTQEGHWTVGMLANQLWSVSGNHGAQNSSAMYLQPFVSYTTHTAMTFSLNTESTYDWETERWAAPVNFAVTQVTRIGKQLISVGGGVGYWTMSPRNGAEGWRARVIVTFLFPKKH